MYILYNLFLLVFIFFSPLWIIFRILSGKENLKSAKEKFGFFTKKSKLGKTIWMHGASVGEIYSIIPIIKKLEKNKKIDQILITSSTLSSSIVLSNYKFKKTTHQFFPIDLNYFSEKFINYWNPYVSIFVESEIWPNMIENLYQKKIPIIILNARITKKSFKKWSYFQNYSKKIFSKISMAIPQNSETAFYLKHLGVKNIKKINNIKYYGERLIKKTNFKLRKKFLKRNLWCAASTHEGEELEIGKMHKKLKLLNKKLLTIIIPRHVSRKKSILKNLKEINLNVSMHSSLEKIDNNTDIYLVDTYGDALNFYNLTKLVFMGGSLIPHGGQNPLEPARLGNFIIYGPYVDNFKEVYKLLKNLKLAHKINKISQIKDIVNKKINYNKENNKINKLYSLGEKNLINSINELNKYF